jgi:LCP family protein required for cell wall assembly
VVADYSLEAIDLLETVFADDEVAPVEERIEEALAEGVDPSALGPELATTTTAGPPTTPGDGLPVGDDLDALATAEPARRLPSPTAAGAGASRLPDELRGLGEEEARAILDRMALARAFPFGVPDEGWLTDGTDRITILLAGGDAGPERWSLRTDVMIIATLDLATGKAALIGLSRDMSNIPLPPEFDQAFVDREILFAQGAGEYAEPFESCRCWPDRLNGLYTFTLHWFRTFPDAPDPGMEALRRTLSLLLGIPIDYYVMVDMAGFVDLVDAIGGVEVTVNESMDVAFSPAREGEEPVAITVEPGRHLLDGHEALAYVRDRTGSNDGARMQRQRCMLRALADEMTPSTLVSRFTQIAGAIKTSTTTNIPLSAVPDLIRLATALEGEDIATLAIGWPTHTGGTDYRGLPTVSPERVRSEIAGVLAGLQAGESFTDDSECP